MGGIRRFDVTTLVFAGHLSLVIYLSEIRKAKPNPQNLTGGLRHRRHFSGHLLGSKGLRSGRWPPVPGWLRTSLRLGNYRPSTSHLICEYAHDTVNNRQTLRRIRRFESRLLRVMAFAQTSGCLVG